MLLLLACADAPSPAAEEAEGYRLVADGSTVRGQNPAHQLRIEAGPQGVRVASPTSHVTLSLARWGAPGALSPAEGPDFALGDCDTTGRVDEAGACLRRATAEHAGARSTLVEWWENRGEGMEQGFTLAAPLGQDELWIELSTDATPTLDGTTVVLVPQQGTPWYWRDLVAYDADHRPLSTALVATPGGFRVEVNLAGATYPVTVDPIVAPYWFEEGPSTSDYFGRSVTPVGDVNGDGYDDIAVGAYGAGTGGTVYVYYGSTTGPSTTADWSYGTTQASAYFGYDVAHLGDVNGDGYDDLGVGAPYYDNGSTNEGAVFVFYGSASGFGTSPDWSYELNQSSAYLGTSVAGAGDVNGDGYDDLVAGAYAYDGGYTDEGAAVVIHGSATGLGTSYAWEAEANQTTAYFGYEVQGIGDVNGDGYDDVAVGATSYDNGSTDEGQVWVYHGSSSGLATSASWTEDPDQTSAGLGGVIAGGDFTGDGYADVLLGASVYDYSSRTSSGAAWLYVGSSTGLATTATWTKYGSSSSTYVGSAAANAGDTNGDGIDDFALSSGSSAETLAVYLGSTGTISSTAAYTATDAGPGDPGPAVATAGDVNADGYADLLTGTPAYSSSTGMVNLFYGSSAGPDVVEPYDWSVTNSSSSYTYRGIATADTDGDGKEELVTTLSYTSTTSYLYVFEESAGALPSSGTLQITGSVSSAYWGLLMDAVGDVNGDGYDDVAVTAYDARVSYSSEGSVYVYYGSSSGLSGSSYARLDGNATDARLGYSIAGLGDVNADGYDDFASGMYGYTSGEAGEGGVRAWYGSSAGIQPDYDWAWEPDQANARAAWTRAAGDVDGDGFDDISLVSPYYDDAYSTEGAVWIYSGSSSGLDSTETWSMTGGQVNAYCGSGTNGSGVGGGDLDGDGYGDFAVGCPSYDTAVTDDGAVFVYHGSSSGPSATPDTTIVGETTLAYVGTGLAFPGDVDGDGTDDLLVGATGYDGLYDDGGALMVFLGGTGGVASEADLTFVGLADTARLGAKVGAAPDLDDDGSPEFFAYASGQDSIYQYDLVDDDGDGSIKWVDCNDGDATAYPGASELCDGLDNDCDGSVDESTPTWYLDADGDGYGNGTYSSVTCTQPSGYVANDDDCDDSDAALSPDATETCDGVDNDCDGNTDEIGATGGSTYYADADGDGYGNAASTVAACSLPSGYANNDDDCDDSTSAVSPVATESCNDTDDDCDGSTDESGATGETTWYRDADGDGYGSSATTTSACDQPSGYVATATDCNDASTSIRPGATESCNGTDDDCDGSTDEGVATTYYRDADGDGYGSATSTTAACSLPSGYVTNASDCDDSSASVKPGGTETCNGADDDCDGNTDEGVSNTYYVDADGDGYGSSTTGSACSLTTGYALVSGDCDDADSATNPAAAETCDDADNDCDGSTDEGLATTTWYRDADGDGFGDAARTQDKCNAPSGFVANDDDCDDTSAAVPDGLTWYADADGDGYGNAASTAYACTAPAGYGSDATDCDDTSAATYPGAAETWYDGADGACDGGSDYDQDGDGYDDDGYGGEDCDDTDADVKPGGADLWYDGVDGNCDGASDYDKDGDGYDSQSYGGDDCDDGNAAVNPASDDNAYDGRDTNCNPDDEYDADRDGYRSADYGGDDCDDADSTTYPGAEETWYDGVDQDCDGNDDDQDGDGIDFDHDCDDTDPAHQDDCPVDTGTPGGDSGGKDSLVDGGGGCGCDGGGGAAGLATVLVGLLAARRRSLSPRR